MSVHFVRLAFKELNCHIKYQSIVATQIQLDMDVILRLYDNQNFHSSLIFTILWNILEKNIPGFG